VDDADSRGDRSPQGVRIATWTMVQAYFDRVTDTYSEKWSDSFPSPCLPGNEEFEKTRSCNEKRIARTNGSLGPGQRCAG